MIDRRNTRPRPATSRSTPTDRGHGAGAGPCRIEIRRRRRRQLAGGLALEATQRADARPRHGQPPLRRHSPPDARRISDHQLPHTLDGRARRLGQQRVELGDEGPGAVLAEGVERVGLHDDPAHAHQLRPTNERGGLRDALHLGRLDRLHQRHVGVRRPAGVPRRPPGVQVADDAEHATDDHAVLLDDLLQAERSAGRLPSQRVESATRRLEPARDVDRAPARRASARRRAATPRRPRAQPRRSAGGRRSAHPTGPASPPCARSRAPRRHPPTRTTSRVACETRAAGRPRASGRSRTGTRRRTGRTSEAGRAAGASSPRASAPGRRPGCRRESPAI